MSGFRDQLVRLAYPYDSIRRVWRGPARGLHYVVGEGMGVSYALGTRDAAPPLFAERLRPSMTVYDVGANKGQMALLFAAVVGPEGRVVALEPAPREFDHLSRNVAVNGLEHVRPVRAAAFRRSGEVTFNYPENRPTQGKLSDVEPTYGRRAATELTVPALRLDDLVEEYGAPDFIKVDVEGAAAAVLEGAGQILEEVRPILYVELHGPEEQAGVRDHVMSRGYIAETLDGSRVSDPSEGWHSPLWCYHPDVGKEGSRHDARGSRVE